MTQILTWGLALFTPKNFGRPSIQGTCLSYHFDDCRALATAVRSVAPKLTPALAKEWVENTEDPWRTETDRGVLMKRGISHAGHGLKMLKKKKQKQKLALKIKLTTVKQIKGLPLFKYMIHM